MSVVVTGAAGFLGGHLLDALAAAGTAVVAVDRRPPPRPPTARTTWLTVDLLDPDPALLAALHAADAVFHLAARPGVRETGEAVERARHRDNVLVTARVLAVVPRLTPVVVTSSSSVYGGSTGRPSREDDPLAPRGGYARSKVAVEQLCARRRAAGGAVAVARPFTLVGERQRPDMALARWVDAARAGRPLLVHGSPQRSRDLTDVHDAVRALLRLAEVGADGPVNVGTGRPTSLADLAHAVAAGVDRPVHVDVVPAGAAEPPATLACTRRLERLLGHRPRTDLAAVVARHLAWLESADAPGDAADAVCDRPAVALAGR